MNVISYEKAYCLFPYATLEERRALIVPSDGPGQEPAIEKYKERGWKMLLSLSSRERNASNPSFALGPRFMGDRHTWTIPLDLTGVQPPRALTSRTPALTTDPVAATSWVFKYEHDEGGDVSFETASSTYLLYKHVLRDEGTLQMVSDALKASITSYALESTPFQERQ